MRPFGQGLGEGERGEYWARAYKNQMDNVQDLILNSTINLPTSVHQLPKPYDPRGEDKVPAIIHVAQTLDKILAILTNWEEDKVDDEKLKPRGRLYTSNFTITDTNGVMHIDFEDQNDDRNVQPGAIVNRPFRKVHTITLINKGAGTIKVQTNDTAESEGGMNTEIEANETLVIDCTDFRGRPVVEDINIAVTTGANAQVKMTVWA